MIANSRWFTPELPLSFGELQGRLRSSSEGFGYERTKSTPFRPCLIRRAERNSHWRVTARACNGQVLSPVLGSVFFASRLVVIAKSVDLDL